MDKTRLVIGPPARGDDLWNREAEIEGIWRVLERGHVLLVAPRRFGKTSIMLNLRDEPRDGYKVFFLDTEWMNGPEYFIAEVATELIKDDRLKQILHEAGGFFNTLINRFAEVEIPHVFKLQLRKEMTKDWEEKGRELVSELQKLEVNILLIADELPLMIHKMLRENAKEAQKFLYWMRALRQNPELSNLRLVIGGSIGIEHVLKQAGTGTKAIHDLHRIQVGPFSTQQCREFVKVLLANEANLKDIGPEIVDSFIDILEIPVPYFIQILVSEAIREAQHQRKSLSAEIVQKAYYERVLASYNRTYFEHYYDRLRDYYLPEDERIAKALLLEIAEKGEVSRSNLWNLYQSRLEGKGNEENLSYLLSDLENDFYIQFDPEKKIYRFATRVLRDCWIRRHSIIDWEVR